MEFLQFLDETFWSRSYLNVPASLWLTVLAAWAGLSVAFILARRFLVWRLAALSRHTQNDIDDLVVEVVRRTHALFLILIALWVAGATFDLPGGIQLFLTRLAFLALLAQVIRWGNRGIAVWIERYRKRKLEQDAAAVTSMQAVGFLARIMLYTVVLLLALDNFGVDITALVAGLGVGGIAVALAVQNILGDLFASLSIVLDKPFVVGDFLVLDDYAGTVEQIGLKTTRLRSLSGEQIVASNGDLLKSRIRNYKRMYERRVVFTVSVVYQTPAEQIAAIPGMIRGIVEAQDRIRFDRAHFKELGPSALTYEVVYYVLDASFNLYMDIQQAINLEIFRRFAAEGIAFAHPTQTIYLEQETGTGNGAVAHERGAEAG